LQKKISVLGCGWLGLPLAEALISANFQVAGSTTSPHKLPVLAEKRIRPFLIDLNKVELSPETAPFFESEILIVNVPPKRGPENTYAVQIRNLQKVLSKTAVRKVIFISSTSVYLPSENLIVETSATESPETNALRQAEIIISDPENSWETTIIRMAGLFGPERAPGRFLAGKTDLPDPNFPVNLIHLQDCINIILAVIAQEKWNTIYNACADEHPSRKEFYTAGARKLKLPEPTFSETDSPASQKKLISSEKVKTELNYNFKFPDPLKALDLL